MQSTWNGVYDDTQWEMVRRNVDHPDNPTLRRADLLRNRHTGIYVLFLGQAYSSCPQRWRVSLRQAQPRAREE